MCLSVRFLEIRPMGRISPRGPPEPRKMVRQNLGQNRPKPLKLKRYRRELSNAVVESLIRRDMTPVMVRRGGRPAWVFLFCFVLVAQMRVLFYGQHRLRVLFWEIKLCFNLKRMFLPAQLTTLKNPPCANSDELWVTGLAKTRVLHFLVVFCLFLCDKTKHMFKCACFGNSANGTNPTQGSSRTTENGSARASWPAGQRARPVLGRFWPRFHAKMLEGVFFLKMLHVYIFWHRILVRIAQNHSN